MPLKSTPLGTSNGGASLLTNPVSLSASWQPLTVAGRASAADGATVTLSSTLDTTDRYIIDTQGRGTSVLVRLKYESNVTVTTPPTIAVFGLDTAPEPGGSFSNYVLQPLYSADGNLTEAITNGARDTQATDSSGTWKYTVPDPTVHAWDRLGCRFVTVAVTAALAVSTGTADSAVLEYRLI